MIQCNFDRYTSKFITSMDKGKFNKQRKQALKAFTNGELEHWNKIDTFVSMEELNSIINALKDYSGSGKTYTCTLGATNLAKLTDAEKAIATEKGWTLV